MAIWTIAHSKGGVGKSTVATNLAIAATLAGQKALLVDSDPQGSSMDWRSLRSERGFDDIAAISLCTPTIHKDLPGIAAGYDITICDTGGRDSKVYRSAVLAADLVVIPCLASQIDLFAASDVVEVVQYAKTFKEGIKAVFVLNQLVAGAKLSEDIKEALADYVDDVALCESSLYARTAYRTAYAAGGGVQELKGREKDAKAAAEVAALYAELSKLSEGGK